MKAFAPLALALSLSGCAMGTGVVPIGPNAYTIQERVVPLAGGGAEAEKRALLQASEFCREHGMIALPSDIEASGPALQPSGPTRSRVTFRCATSSDPAVASYQPPTVRTVEPSPQQVQAAHASAAAALQALAEIGRNSGPSALPSGAYRLGPAITTCTRMGYQTNCITP